MARDFIVLAPLGSEGEGIATLSTKRKGDLGGPKHWGKLRPLLPDGVPVGQLMQQHWHCWRICHGWLRFSELTGELQVSKGAGREGREAFFALLILRIAFNATETETYLTVQFTVQSNFIYYFKIISHFIISFQFQISIYYLFHFGFCCSGAYRSHPRPGMEKKNISQTVTDSQKSFFIFYFQIYFILTTRLRPNSLQFYTIYIFTNQ